MPTTNWILEAAEDRYWEGIAPFELEPEPEIECPFCARSFHSQSEFKTHLGLDHPLALPALLIRGKPQPSEFTIRTSLQRSHVDLCNTSVCFLRADGAKSGQLKPVELLDRICSETYGLWELGLVNKRIADEGQAESRYLVRFRVPRQEALNIVDQQFVQRLAVDKPSHLDLQQFLDACPKDPCAIEYAGALGDYVLGVMLKEQPGAVRAPIQFDEFKAKMASSMEILAQFARPVAHAVTATIDFNLNNFDSSRKPSRLYALGAGQSLFRAIIAGDSVPRVSVDAEPKYTAPICPLDTVSHQLLSVCERLTRGARIPITLADDLVCLSKEHAISEYDMSKINVLCAVICLENNDRSAATPHLRALQFHFLFGHWARAKIEEPT